MFQEFHICGMEYGKARNATELWIHYMSNQKCKTSLVLGVCLLSNTVQRPWKRNLQKKKSSQSETWWDNAMHWLLTRGQVCNIAVANSSSTHVSRWKTTTMAASSKMSVHMNILAIVNVYCVFLSVRMCGFITQADNSATSWPSMTWCHCSVNENCFHNAVI